MLRVVTEATVKTPDMQIKARTVEAIKEALRAG